MCNGEEGPGVCSSFPSPGKRSSTEAVTVSMYIWSWTVKFPFPYRITRNVLLGATSACLTVSSLPSASLLPLLLVTVRQEGSQDKTQGQKLYSSYGL